MNKEKFEIIKDKILFDYVDKTNQTFLKKLFEKYIFSFQESKFLCEAAIDLRMWKEKELKELWHDAEKKVDIKNFNQRKKEIFKLFRNSVDYLKKTEKIYSESHFDTASW